MSKIIYPCETGAMFRDVIFALRMQSSDDLISEAENAWLFFKERFPDASHEELKGDIRYSFWGLQLTCQQIIDEAAA